MLFRKTKKPGKEGRLDEALRNEISAYIKANETSFLNFFDIDETHCYFDLSSAPNDYSFTSAYEPGAVDECDDMWEEACPPAPSAAPMPSASIDLSEFIKKADAGFAETLLKLIDRSGKKDSEVYRKANISRQHFSKIRNNYDYRPTKATALAFAIALELDMDETKDLIGRAGYALTTSSKFDLIIMYFIERGRYDIFEINTALYEFDQSLLGA